MDLSWDPTIALIVAAVGVLLIGLIFFFGQPRKPGQGRRLFGRSIGKRKEPALDGSDDDDADHDSLVRELERLDRTLAGEAGESRASPRPARSTSDAAATAPTAAPDFDKIVSLHIAAREGSLIRGSDLVVAAEKAGLSFGAMSIFHRMVDGRPEAGPVFSVANMVKPGTFDMRALDELQTPGLSFFMTLPGPLPGLDAWETMLPAAQRMAELLDASLLDEQRNALGRQRIAHLREELRRYDRKHAGEAVGSRW
jgi:cell division protein ZipA